MYRNFAVVIVYYMYDCVICDQKEDNIYMFKSAMFFSFNYFLFLCCILQVKKCRPAPGLSPGTGGGRPRCRPSSISGPCVKASARTQLALVLPG